MTSIYSVETVPLPLKRQIYGSAEEPLTVNERFVLIELDKLMSTSYLPEPPAHIYTVAQVVWRVAKEVIKLLVKVFVLLYIPDLVGYGLMIGICWGEKLEEGVQEIRQMAKKPLGALSLTALICSPYMPAVVGTSSLLYGIHLGHKLRNWVLA